MVVEAEKEKIIMFLILAIPKARDGMYFGLNFSVVSQHILSGFLYSTRKILIFLEDC